MLSSSHGKGDCLTMIQAREGLSWRARGLAESELHISLQWVLAEKQTNKILHHMDKSIDSILRSWGEWLYVMNESAFIITHLNSMSSLGPWYKVSTRASLEEIHQEGQVLRTYHVRRGWKRWACSSWKRDDMGRTNSNFISYNQVHMVSKQAILYYTHVFN